MTTDPERPSYLDALLRQHLHHLLGDTDAEATTLLLQQLQWPTLPGGATLMTQGDAGDAMYLLVSGRLRALITDAEGKTRAVRDVTRGQVVGEMSLHTNAPRSATMVAVRDSVRVRLGKPEFQRVLGLSATLSVLLTRTIIERLQTESRAAASERPVAMALLPVTAGVDTPGFARRLVAAMGAYGRIALVDAAALDTAAGMPGLAQAAMDDVAAGQRIGATLDGIEALHDHVLLVGDDTAGAWSQRCRRHSDELLLLADADQPPQVHANERPRPAADAAPWCPAEVLVLLHPEKRQCPRRTRDWLARRPVADHVHIRPALDRDMARLARLQTRHAVGLVFAGGGARGLAHLGVWQALTEQGVDVDVVGGTSIGAIMAALVAADQAPAQVLPIARRAFLRKPTSDFNFLPLMSLIKGMRVRSLVRDATQELLGAEADLEDLWKGCFAIASSYSNACEKLLRDGPLQQTLLASAAIPGALPPVIRDGELLCDGGTFNNFPVDVMRGWRGVGSVIGVDLGVRNLRRLQSDEVPGTWALLRDRLRPRT